MLLLTGATGVVGTALLRRLTAAGTPVRCLVRDPRRLGAERVRVQIALGDLADPPSFRNALRGVKTVVHLAASIRDQPQGSIEELNGIATWRLVQAAERAGVEHFVFFSALSASIHDRTRFLRAKALAEEAVRDSPLRTTIFAPSIVYAPGGPLRRPARAPLAPAGHARPGPGTGALPADLGRGRRRLHDGRAERRRQRRAAVRARGPRHAEPSGDRAARPARGGPPAARCSRCRRRWSRRRCGPSRR